MTHRLLASRLELFARAPGYRLLFLAALGSGLGTWLAYVALVIDISERTDDARWVSALLIVEFLPMVLIGLLAAPLVDRLPRRGIIVGSDRETLEEARAGADRHLRALVAALSLVVRSRPLLTVLVAWSVMRGPYGLAIGTMGAGLLAAAASPNVWVASVFVALAGIGNGGAVVCNADLVQRGAPDRLRGRAFSVLNAAGTRTVWVAAAGLCAVGAALGFLLLTTANGALAAASVR